MESIIDCSFLAMKGIIPSTRRHFHVTTNTLAFNLRNSLNSKTKSSSNTTPNDQISNDHIHSSHKHSSLLIQPSIPVRARFAPSPTGFLHLGSLRTALYNYLLAKSTNGTFILRLEDTDQNRLIDGAEENIYQTLKWLNIKMDESPINNGPHSPYRQSERSSIYSHYANHLLEKGLAYRCFCSKHRLDGLRDSARLLKPPTTVSYDRHCINNITIEESNKRMENGESFTIRFKSPNQYPTFIDLLHGEINLQPQINSIDKRFEDPVLMKSDGLPTYHFANVIDDHLMEITHVIRGEEWVASTPKHIALYNAFGWEIPKFIHIPLLTTVAGKKLSKRSGDIDIMSLKNKGYLPEALINFSVLFGWNPKRDLGEKVSEIYSLDELCQNWSINGLTKGNAKVDWKKLDYFNKHYLTEKLKTFNSTFFQNAVEESYQNIKNTLNLNNLQKDKVSNVLKMIYPSLVKLNDFNTEMYHYFFISPTYNKDEILSKLKIDNQTLTNIVDKLVQNSKSLSHEQFNETINIILLESPDLKKRIIFQVLRYALSGPQSGINLPIILELLGPEEVQSRLQNFQTFLKL